MIIIISKITISSNISNDIIIDTNIIVIIFILKIIISRNVPSNVIIKISISLLLILLFSYYW